MRPIRFAAALAASLVLAPAAVSAQGAVGAARVPTQKPGDNSTWPANTAYVDAAASTLLNVIAGKAPLASPAFTGIVGMTGTSPLLDLITSRPDNGTFTSAAGAPLQAEPVLGPFHGVSQDLTRAQTVRWFTTTGDSNKGEYGTLLNMISRTGFPDACARAKFYPEGGTCLNDGGKMYRVKAQAGAQTYYGTTASTGTGPTGTGDTIADGGVTWRYEPNYSPGNGGKTNLALMTYQDANSGAAWTGAFAHQIAAGGPKKNATTLELDINNYWGDYATGPVGPAAVGLQIFAGGGRRSSAAISIGQYDQPSDSTSLVNGITLGGSTLVRDNTIYDLTSSANGFFSQGSHSGSAFTEGGASTIAFNAYGTYSRAAFRAGGTGVTGLEIDGTYSGFQVKGTGWSVSPSGGIAASGLDLKNGTITGVTATGAGVGNVSAGLYLDANNAALRAPSTGGTLFFQAPGGSATWGFVNSGGLSITGGGSFTGTASASMFQVLKSGVTTVAAGPLTNAPSYTGVSVNGTLAGADMAGILGSPSDPNLYVNGKTGIQFQIGDNGVASVNASGLSVTGGITVGSTLKAAALPTAGGTTKGTLCVDTSGVVYVKTSTGACL